MPQPREKSKSKSKSRERKGQCFLCERPSSTKCPTCGLVFYCSADHLLAHRHQNYCFPFRCKHFIRKFFLDMTGNVQRGLKFKVYRLFRVKWRSGKGRCLVATRDIKPMELIMIDAAIAHGPRNLTSPVCLECCAPVDGSYLCGR